MLVTVVWLGLELADGWESSNSEGSEFLSGGVTTNDYGIRNNIET